MKTTKKNMLAVILFIISLLLSSCFKDDANHHYRIPFKNNTGRRMYLDYHIYWNWLPLLDHLDTVLNNRSIDPRVDSLASFVEPMEENTVAMFSTSFYEGELGICYDTLIVFVFDADTLEAVGWDVVCSEYKVLQRYDLSLENLQDLDFKLCFPPSEAMKHIHMWPPYGTYDAHGNLRGIP